MFLPFYAFAVEDFTEPIVTNCQGKADLGECNWNDLIELINRIIKFLVYAATSFSVVSFAYAGFLYLSSAGDHGKVEEAHHIFKNVMIGMFFVLAGWLIVATILKGLIRGDDRGMFNLIDYKNVDVNIVE